MASLTEDQSKYGVVSHVLLPFEGEESEGVEGTADTLTEKEPEPGKLSPYE